MLEAREGGWNDIFENSKTVVSANLGKERISKKIRER